MHAAPDRSMGAARRVSGLRAAGYDQGFTGRFDESLKARPARTTRRLPYDRAV